MRNRPFPVQERGLSFIRDSKSCAETMNDEKIFLTIEKPEPV
jgi:hypothetical protein